MFYLMIEFNELLGYYNQKFVTYLVELNFIKIMQKSSFFKTIVLFEFYSRKYLNKLLRNDLKNNKNSTSWPKLKNI